MVYRVKIIRNFNNIQQGNFLDKETVIPCFNMFEIFAR